MADVFISYSREDSAFAEQLSSRLRREGLSVAIDRDVLIAGAPWPERLGGEIEMAKVVVLLLSGHTRKRDWVQQELIFALKNNSERLIIPVLLDDTAKDNPVWPLVADMKPVRVVEFEDPIEEVAMIASSRLGPRPAKFSVEHVSEARSYGATRSGFGFYKIALPSLGVALIFMLTLTMFTRPATVDNKLRYTISILDTLSDTGVSGTSVSLKAGRREWRCLTDSQGRCTFTLSGPLHGTMAVVQAIKPGYKSSTFLNPIPVNQGEITLRLEPTSPPPPQPSTSSPTRLVETLSFSSDPKASGSMKNFSQWYALCSAQLPKGAAVESVAFSLSGDRSCGAWAECREKERSNDRVCWEFRLQGHDDWRPPGQAFSIGNLRVRISRPAQPSAADQVPATK
jgi:hypothetical protein